MDAELDTTRPGMCHRRHISQSPVHEFPAGGSGDEFADDVAIVCELESRGVGVEEV